jgi:hypothetical protein
LNPAAAGRGVLEPARADRSAQGLGAFNREIGPGEGSCVLGNPDGTSGLSANHAHEDDVTDDHVIGWTVDEAARAALIARFPPRYSDVIAHHVTLQARVPADTPLPPHRACEIVGEADDGQGVQAMVVRMDRTTDRPDGSTFHITWSLDKARGRRAQESNDVIRERGWTPLPEPAPVAVVPARFPR